MNTSLGCSMTTERRLRVYYDDGPTWEQVDSFRTWDDVASFVQWNRVREL